MALTKLNDNSLSSITGQGLPSGSVINTVSTNVSGAGTYVQNATTTMADAGLSASITPTSTSSKVLVIIAAQLSSSTASSVEGQVDLYRGSTLLETYERAAMHTDPGGQAIHVGGNKSFVYLDSPSTTSSTTYKIQVGLSTGSGRIRFNDYASTDASASSITLMEIKG